MLEHQLLVLENLSTDKKLFKKELIKSMKWLPSHEIIKLHQWVRKYYGNTHQNIINEVFQMRMIGHA